VGVTDGDTRASRTVAERRTEIVLTAGYRQVNVVDRLVADLIALEEPPGRYASLVALRDQLLAQLRQLRLTVQRERRR
jgi:hypothetical protein